jgi:hypothetical protein
MKIKNIKSAGSKSLKIVSVNKANNYANDPLVIKKGRESKKFLDKHGFPEELITKR